MFNVLEQNKKFMTEMQKCKYDYVYRTANSKHCFDLSGLISAVGVTDVYSRQYPAEKEFFACGTRQALCLCLV